MNIHKSISYENMSSSVWPNPPISIYDVYTTGRFLRLQGRTAGHAMWYVAIPIGGGAAKARIWAIATRAAVSWSSATTCR